MLLALAALVGCSSDAHEQPAAEPRVWVGTVQDSDAMLGVVESRGAASLFLCGGPSSFASQTHWFFSPTGLDSAFSMTDGGFQLEGSTSSDQIVGTLRQDSGDTHSFSVQQVNGALLAGVYDALGPCGHLGLIVLPNAPGELPAAQGTCLKTEAGAELVEQVNPVMPLARSANAGVAVTVDTDLDQVFILHPLVPAAGS
ncbi:MAG TPA: hypothetical protein VGJ91_18685 [Polyangiaceae bacterium]|jgi:hypothetical protein